MSRAGVNPDVAERCLGHAIGGQRGVYDRHRYIEGMRHAFEGLGAVRVQLKTDARNVQSQTAIARLGAVREGVLRKHMLLHDGFLRDTVVYSILDDEWPVVKDRLKAKMAAHAGPGGPG